MHDCLSTSRVAERREGFRGSRVDGVSAVGHREMARGTAY